MTKSQALSLRAAWVKQTMRARHDSRYKGSEVEKRNQYQVEELSAAEKEHWPNGVKFAGVWRLSIPEDANFSDGRYAGYTEMLNNSLRFMSGVKTREQILQPFVDKADDGSMYHAGLLFGFEEYMRDAQSLRQVWADDNKEKMALINRR